MYEYETTVWHGINAPAILTPPRHGFRLRDMHFTETGRTRNYTTGWEFGPQGKVPYIQSMSESKIGHWTLLWERYVPQQENE